MCRIRVILAAVVPMWLVGLDLTGLLSQIIEEDQLYVYGLADQPFEQGIWGHGEVSPSVRVTVINGIMNNIGDCKVMLETLSSAHVGVNIHYIYWNSERKTHIPKEF